PQLVAHLNGEGLPLRLVSNRKDGVVAHTAYLTITGRTWEDLIGLRVYPEEIRHWRCTLYCERGTGSEDNWSDLSQLWGDCCLVVGPFLFFGDRELLGRVRAALTRS